MSNAFTVMPMSQEISLEAGQVYHGSIKISVPDDATEDFYYAVTVSPYSVMDEDYTADFTTMSDWSRIAEWITIDEPKGVVKHNEIKEISFTIAVPDDAPSGGQYAIIGVASDEEMAASEGMMIQDVFEIASVIFAQVEGETRHEGEILTNEIPGFVTNGLPVVGSVLTNNGNVHEKATVKIRVKNVLTGEIIYPKEEDPEAFYEYVMPDSVRYVKRTLDNIPILGIYEVSQEVEYLGAVSPRTVTMISSPIWFVLLVILTIGTLIGTIAAGIRARIKKRQVF